MSSGFESNAVVSARDRHRRRNYYESLALETLAMVPRAPVLMAQKPRLAARLVMFALRFTRRLVSAVCSFNKREVGAK